MRGQSLWRVVIPRSKAVVDEHGASLRCSLGVFKVIRETQSVQRRPTRIDVLDHLDEGQAMQLPEDGIGNQHGIACTGMLSS